MLAVAVAGCASRTVTATATIHPDGSFQRTLTYAGPDFDASAVSSRPAPSTVADSDLAPAFSPPQGAAWTLAGQQDSKGHRQITATRQAAVGQPIIGDLGVLTPKATYQATCLANRVEVVRLATNQLQYREVVRWRGPLPDFLRIPDPAFRRLVVRALPSDAATLSQNSAAVDRIAVRLQRGLYAPLFGYAPSPLLASSSARESAAQEKRDAARWMRSLGHAAVLPELTCTEKDSVANRFAVALVRGAKTGLGDATTSPLSLGVALHFHVNMPGRITATNGTQDSRQDPTKRQVEWMLPPEAAALGDVTLTATCDASAAPMKP